MKIGFFEELKQYLINNEKENLPSLIPYYETLLQHKDSLSEILKDYEKYYVNIQYDEDEENDYNDGFLTLYFYEKSLDEDYGWKSSVDYYYKIELQHDDRMWGYCMCKPDDRGYVEKHRCCGNGCDYVFPQINVTKIIDIAYKSFNGAARDLWELEEKWVVYLKEHNDQVKQRELERLEESIRELEQRKLKLLNT